VIACEPRAYAAVREANRFALSQDFLALPIAGCGKLDAWAQHAGPSTAGEQMTVITDQISRLLHEAGETHHRVFRIVDGADDDWASWYADWLVNLSELPSLLGTKPVRSELTYLLVSLDKDYAASQPGESWESYYAQRILDHFSSSGRI
jgi:hypothetical protein